MFSSISFRDKQIKTIMRSHYLSERLKLKRLIILSIGKDTAELVLTYTVRTQHGTTLHKLFSVSHKGKHVLIIQPHMSTSTQGNDNVCLHYFCIHVYSHIIQNNSKVLKNPNAHQNVNYMWYAHRMECYSAIKRSKLIFITDVSQKC